MVSAKFIAPGEMELRIQIVTPFIVIIWGIVVSINFVNRIFAYKIYRIKALEFTFQLEY